MLPCVLKAHEENKGGPLGGPRNGGSIREVTDDLATHRARLVRCAFNVLGDSAEAEDVAQEVLSRGLRAELRDPGALGAWLLAACTRLSIDRYRRRGRHAKALTRIPPAKEPLDPGRVVLAQAEADRARLALDGLPEPYRKALQLRYLDELSVAEIAKRLDAKERTVRTWLGRGLTKLRTALGAE